MDRFEYIRPNSIAPALEAGASDRAAYLGGGTSLVDLMRLGLERPRTVVDVSRLGLEAISEDSGDIFFGAMATNTAVAEHALVRAKAPALSQALLSGASPQVRNMATAAGNLLQRTRCSYFRDPSTPCNKKNPGSGCPALDGHHRMHAVLGGSALCIAAHPSDMCVALAALDAKVVTHERTIPLEDFHVVPGEHPEVESVLKKGELIRGVRIPITPLAGRSTYLKVRDRSEFAFALVSVAAALEVAEGKISAARIALGGVATKPWRSRDAEQLAIGKQPTPETFQAMAAEAMRTAQPRKYNAFKIELAKRAIVRALASAARTT